VAGGIAGGGVDIGYAGFLLVDGEQDFILNDLPVWFVGHGIVWNLVDVTRRSEIIERLRCFLLVERKSPNGGPQLGEVGSQRPFASRNNGTAVGRNSNGQQNRDDAQDDHQLDQSETESLAPAGRVPFTRYCMLRH